MDSKQIIMTKAQEIFKKGQELQSMIDEKHEAMQRLQKEISEMNQSLLVFEGAYTAYQETLSLLEESEEAATEKTTEDLEEK